jgi:excinuclease UvrABC nuclease subunit
MANAEYLRVAPSFRTLSWNSVALLGGMTSSIPGVSCVYVYGEVSRVGGLPVQVSWKYVGKSLNLRHRVRYGHCIDREKNQKLRAWLGKSYEAELWYALVPREKLDCVETRLIRELRPEFNVQKKVCA